MNEIIDVINFLAKEGVCKDMQREIMSYFNNIVFINVLRMSGFRGAGYYEGVIFEEYFLHSLNRNDFKPIIRRTFEIIQEELYLENCIINTNDIIVDAKSYSIEKLAEEFKTYGILDRRSFPFNKLKIGYHNIYISLETRIVKCL